MPFQSIPASQIVSVTPGVLSSGGNPLSLNAVFLTQNATVPDGSMLTFSDADSVASFFGDTANETIAAQKYFLGFDNSNKKPGTLYFAQFNTAAVAAYLRSGSFKSITLAALKTYSGSLTVMVDGVAKTAASLSLAAATSFSNAATIIQTALGAGLTVAFSSQLQAFTITSSTTGAASTVEYATGTLADTLLLTETKGAVKSLGDVAETPASMMAEVVKTTQNWATFTTLWEPTTADKQAFADWTNSQNQRYAYVAWDTDASAKISGNTTSFGALMLNSKPDGIIPLWVPSLAEGIKKAAFLCGAIASIDFSETNGRITLKFKGQSGLEPDVTDSTDATNLSANGYNYYGAWATANDRFQFLSEGSMPGKWKWIDAYVDQVWMNSQFQLALMTLLTSAKSVPYNADGYALIRAACDDVRKAAKNFGAVRAGVTLSEQQRAIVDQAVGNGASDQIETIGDYLFIGSTSAQDRGNRKTPPLKYYYTDGGSVHSINLPSINIM